MTSDNRATRSSSTASTKSSFSIDNILNLQDSEPQEARKMEIFPQGLSNVHPFAGVPTLMPQALRPSLMDYNVMQMLPPLPLQSPLNFEDFHMAATHPFPTFPFNFGYPAQGIPMPLNPFLKRRKRFMRKPKQRPLFAHSQIERLEKEFGEEKYLTEAKRGELSKDLGMTETQVKTWYQNRRTKWRKEIKEKMNSDGRSEENRPKEERGSHVWEDTLLSGYDCLPQNLTSPGSFSSKLQEMQRSPAIMVESHVLNPRIQLHSLQFDVFNFLHQRYLLQNTGENNG